ncbi:MAG: lysophospholipid acyltransferase family protein [Cyanobacteriota bacterium]|nr:lysophospholipid acyltransferase family protein [Cyanobacteriota bacterium]
MSSTEADPLVASTLPPPSLTRRLLLGVFFALFARPLLLLVMGVNVFGRQHLPPLRHGRPFILIANHNSHLDALALMSLFPLRRLAYLHPVAASDYFLSNRLVGWLVTTFMNILPIPRSSLSKHQHPIALMSEQLRRGHSLILFPEGSRGEPEVMREFKRGVAHLIKRHPEIPVIPVFLKGMGRALPRGEVMLVPFFCDVLIGPPVHLPNPANKAEVMSRLAEAFAHLRQQLEASWLETEAEAEAAAAEAAAAAESLASRR